jgi:hypothetical protein
MGKSHISTYTSKISNEKYFSGGHFLYIHVYARAHRTNGSLMIMFKFSLSMIYAVNSYTCSSCVLSILSHDCIISNVHVHVLVHYNNKYHYDSSQLTVRLNICRCTEQ